MEHKTFEDLVKIYEALQAVHMAEACPRQAQVAVAMLNDQIRVKMLAPEIISLRESTSQLYVNLTTHRAELDRDW